MHPNLERRFTELEVARSQHRLKLMAFGGRFHYLFHQLAADLKLTPDELGSRLGWSPIPDGGNAVMRGDAEPSDLDCYRLMCVYLDDLMKRPVVNFADVPRCERCGWPLVERLEDGCVVGNCSMR